MKLINIDTAASTIAIAGILLVSGLIIKDHLASPADAHVAVAEVNQIFSIGDRLPSFSTYRYADHKKTLLIFARQNCIYCERSIPFYRRLIAVKSGKKLELAIVFVFPDEVAKARDFCQRGKLESEVFAGINLDNFKVRGTPTLILVDSSGKVVQGWVGELNPTRESEVLRSITF